VPFQRPSVSPHPLPFQPPQVRAAQALELPIIVSEQYPKALGSTVPEVADVLPEGTLVVAKTRFSMLVPEIVAAIEALPSVKSVLVVGIETHVCVAQTTLDLIERGYDVHVLTDGVSSQRLEDRATALHRLSRAGAFLSTSEMAMFDMMVETAHPAFKAVSALCKEQRPDQLPSL
jgi:nicotinamidase-related amidase